MTERDEWTPEASQKDEIIERKIEIQEKEPEMCPIVFSSCSHP
jgi:hypothetical protein